MVSAKALLLVPADKPGEARLRLTGDLTEISEYLIFLRVTFEGFQVLHSLPQHSELVKLSSHVLTGWDHSRQLLNEIVHFDPPSLLNLAVRLPVDTMSQCNPDGCHIKCKMSNPTSGVLRYNVEVLFLCL